MFIKVFSDKSIGYSFKVSSTSDLGVIVNFFLFIFFNRIFSIEESYY